MVTRRIKRQTQDLPTTVDLDAQVGDYLLNRSALERATVVVDRYKKRFMDLLERAGVLEENGSRSLLLEEPVVFTSYKGGKAKEKEITGIRRQYRAGQTHLNEERTMAYLAKHKLLDRCTSTITVINEDAVLAANFEEKISDADLAALYDTTEPTYAFYLLEGDDDDGRD